MKRDPRLDVITDTTGAAEILDLTPERVRQLDDELQPALLRGRKRIYSVSYLERFKTEREQRKAR